MRDHYFDAPTWNHLMRWCWNQVGLAAREDEAYGYARAIEEFCREYEIDALARSLSWPEVAAMMDATEG